MPIGHILNRLAMGQSENKAGQRKDDYLRDSDLPHFMNPYHAVYRERFEKSGKERQVSTGTLQEKGVEKPSTLTWELPGKFRLEKDGKALVGAGPGVAAPVSTGNPTEAEADLMESLFLDRAEMALYSVAAGASIRPIGYQVALQPGRLAGYTGPYFDVFDISSRIDGKGSSTVRTKRFLFDSMSGLLQRVRYSSGSSGVDQIVETSFPQWGKVGNDFVPVVIERRVNQVVVGRFTASNNVLGAKAKDGSLDRP